jgi:hypothetical protein
LPRGQVDVPPDNENDGVAVKIEIGDDEEKEEMKERE